mgnify:CR=1 FL=1
MTMIGGAGCTYAEVSGKTIASALFSFPLSMAVMTMIRGAGCTVAEVFDDMKLSALKCLFPWQGGLIAPVAKTLGCSHALVAVISALFHILLVGFYFSSSLSII